MEFRISATFTDSLSHLTGEEQKAVKTTSFDLQLNPANPGMSFHKLDKAKDKNFWSVRVSSDIRLIVHRTSESPSVRFGRHRKNDCRITQGSVSCKEIPRSKSVIHNIFRATCKCAQECAGLDYRTLDDVVETEFGHVAVGTMHLAKGLEFRAVAVMACDDEVIPLQSRIENVADDADLEEIYNTERHLLYVACTRARDSLLVTGVKPGSEFLDDLHM